MRTAPFTLLLLLALAGGCVMRSVVRPAALPEGGREVRDLPYWEGEDFDPKKNLLDVYAPPGPGPHPVVVFVHGGGWRLGDRQQALEPYQKLGRRLASRGVLAVVVSYRLSPGFKHPAQIRDVSRALAWASQHVAEYGGDPHRLFAMGHSAGAHLVALAATDPRWLAEVGASPALLAGVVAVSGPYDVEHLGNSLFFGGLTMVRPTFGTDKAVWRDAMPELHLKDGRPPPFLLAWADGDPELLRRDARVFDEALLRAHVPVQTFQTPFDDHFSVITDFADDGNALGERVLQFIEKTAPTPRALASTGTRF